MKKTFLIKTQLFLLLSMAVMTHTYAATTHDHDGSLASPPPAVDDNLDDTLTPSPTVKDPYERFNRIMFRFNDTLDQVILKPVATLYTKVVPAPVSKGLSNFYNNIDTIPTILNDVLQANFYQATSDFWRFTINSTAGVAGFFDVATHLGLEYNKEDFGLTLARWGYKNSNYLVLPFMGPGTVRDQAGWMINYQYLSIYPYIYPIRTRYQIYFTGVVVRRAELLRYENVMEAAAIDKYTFVRDAYLQRRNYQIQRNEELADPYLDKNNSKSKPTTEE